MTETPAPGDFEFGEWTTPFTDIAVQILEITCTPCAENGTQLVARIYAPERGATYRLVFPTIAAMRLLDEGGLLEFWQKTEELGGRPGQTTFRVRNHAWSHESVLSFLPSNGWSFVIATEDDCLEVVSEIAPAITEDQDTHS